jgi:hypothetical protein
MALDYYDFKHTPFSPTPDLAQLFLTPSHRAALMAMLDGVQTRSGLVVITGREGIGKMPLDTLASLSRLLTLETSQVKLLQIVMVGSLPLACRDDGNGGAFPLRVWVNNGSKAVYSEGQNLKVVPPFGVEMLTVVASRSPLDTDQEGPNVEPAAQYLERLGKRLEGYKAEGNAAIAHVRIRTQKSQSLQSAG